MEPPDWLLPEQIPSFRRALAALRRYRGALLADPVGSGKTFVALAVARELNRGTTACLVPATLLAQWQATAARLQTPVSLCSHEQVSRGRLPQSTGGLVLIDESHHFRNPATQRYRHLAPWLVNRPALLITGTPIVNRMSDLAHQLLLSVRDDALLPDGIPSLKVLLASCQPAEALGQLVLENDGLTDLRPRSRSWRSLPSREETAVLAHRSEPLDRLRLSRSVAIAALIRGVLLRALVSSPAALEGALRRYRHLLLHARDAMEAGRELDRAGLRSFTRSLGDQLIWWELLPAGEAHSEIELSDLEQLPDLITRARAAIEEPDSKLDRLRHMLEDGDSTIVFTAFRDTVRYLRDRLPELRPAWCTGERAGVGAATVSRDTVLGWFREATTNALVPRHLFVTDVAAEGLDLQRTARVVHYDLPWTPMRLLQREGRSVRYGSRHAEVEVVQFGLPPLLEGRLALEQSLARKAELPGKAGIGPAGHHVWRWRSNLARQFNHRDARPGVARVSSTTAGLLAGFSLHRLGESGTLSSSVLWLEEDGSWTDNPEQIGGRLEAAALQSTVVPMEAGELGDWLARLALPLRQRLTLTQSRRWISREPCGAARRAMARVQLLIRDAARWHQAERLRALEHALKFLAGGHTAGEALLIDGLSAASDRDFPALLARLPSPASEMAGVDIRLTGLVVFGPPSRPLGQEQVSHRGNRRAHRHGQDPGPDNSLSHSPPNGREPLGRTDAHDRTGNGVGGTDRHTETRRDQHGDPARGLGAEASKRPKPGDPSSHRLDDTPPPQRSTERNGGVRCHLDPERDLLGIGYIEEAQPTRFRREKVLGGNQQADDDSHRLLGVVSSVAQRVERCGNELQPSKGLVEGSGRKTS